jgi:hypothetical protein
VSSFNDSIAKRSDTTPPLKIHNWYEEKDPTEQPEKTSGREKECPLLPSHSCVAFAQYDSLELQVTPGPALKHLGCMDALCVLSFQKVLVWSHLHSNTTAARAAFFAGVVGAYRAFATRLAGAFCFVIEQVGGLDGHVDDICVLEGKWEVYRRVSGSSRLFARKQLSG